MVAPEFTIIRTSSVVNNMITFDSGYVYWHLHGVLSFNFSVMCELFSKTELKWHLKFKKHKPNQSKPYVIKSYAIVDKTKQKIQRKISNIDEVMVG